MKKIRLITVAVIIFVLILFVAPSILTAAPIPFNEHYYSIYLDNVSWTQSRHDAETITYKPDPNGPTYRGHLVAITSQAEQDFINSTFSNDGDAYWIGGYQTGNNEPLGGWKWVTGEKWQYANWGGGEPSNSGGDENYAEFRSSDGSWNDVTNEDEEIDGYILEFEIRHETKEETVEPEVWVRDHDHDMLPGMGK